KFSWWRENHITTLIKIANAIELDHPELAWGRHHYKSFKWIEKHGKWLKSKKTRALKNDGDQSLPASSQPSSSKVRKTNATAPTRQTSSHTSTSSNKKRKAHDTAPELQTSAKEAKGKAKAPASASQDDEDDFSENDDPPREARSHAPKMKTPIEKLNDIAKQRYSASDLIDDSDEEIAAYTPSGAADNATILGSASTSPLKNISNSNADASGTKDASSPQLSAAKVLSQLKTRHVGASLKLPNRSTTPMAKEPAPSPQPLAQSTSTAEAPAGPSLLALSALRKADASRLEVPTVAALRLALSSRFAALTPRADVEQALEVLETSCGCGNEPRATADKMFDVWLSGIEDLAPDHTDDEDELGQGFGHREIGRFDYRTTLKRINAWGSIKNALRLLSALLRIWAIGMSQLAKDTTSEVQPLVHNHIKQVAELI
ncbi:unnamed protein product, partial [Tilletia laevis]